MTHDSTRSSTGAGLSLGLLTPRVAMTSLPTTSIAAAFRCFSRAESCQLLRNTWLIGFRKFVGVLIASPPGTCGRELGSSQIVSRSH